METLTWDPRDLDITWGEIELEGPAPGTFVTVAFDAPMTTKTVGPQGFVVVTISANNGGLIKWVASQASPTNDRLSAIAALQRKKGVGLIKKPILVKHRNGTTLVIGPEAWIMQNPEAPFSENVETREWAFDIANMQAFIGGSSR